MNIQIQILSTSIETKPTQKGSYQQLEVAYKDLSNGGKVASKKIMSFSNKKVFDTLSIAKAAATFDIAMEKNDKGYWDWKEVTRIDASAIVSVPVAAIEGSTTKQGNTNTTTRGGWETPEERAKKQVYIVRQSSISAAISALTATGKVVPKPEEVIEYARQLEAYVFDTNKAEAVVAQDISTMDEDIPF